MPFMQVENGGPWCHYFDTLRSAQSRFCANIDKFHVISYLDVLMVIWSDEIAPNWCIGIQSMRPVGAYAAVPDQTPHRE